MSSQFDVIDHAIISDYLEVARPPGAADIDLGLHLYARIERGRDLLGGEENPLEWRFDDLSISNAVARLVLAPVVDQVQAVVPYERRVERMRPSPVVSQFLLAVRWHDSGPNPSLEGYTLGYLPEYEQYVLVASRKGGFWYGYSDRAVAAMPADRPAPEAAEALLVEWWTVLLSGLPSQPWEEVWAAGSVDEVQALAWASRVWGPELVEAINRDPRQPGPRPDRERSVAALDAIVARRRAAAADNVTPLPGAGRYRVFKGTAALASTCFMELRPGRGDGTYWHESALYVDEEDFHIADFAVRRHLRSYDEYNTDNNLPRVLGLRVAADWEAAAGALEEGSAVARMYRDLAAGLREMYEDEEWICIIGI
ncbi:MAG: hypothetical protein U5S82_19955 [Gammaproteobacteria bacterium]|nr:hypothetical protein [Gammaproteobacteria bacterium]